jgi:ABC-2 type transport system ATP-binding protein
MDTTGGLSARGLHKTFGETPVLEGVDLEIPEGTIFALLGPNGSGKTTTVRICSTLITPDRGTVRVDGHDALAEPDAVRRSIGVTGQFSAVDDLLSGRENLILVADLLRLGRGEGRRRADELLERFDLTDAAGRRAGTYSGGMRRRLDLALTLVGAPRVIFLDEPTTGLDPRSRRTMWEIVGELAAGGTTIFLTTQYLEEADQLADRIALLDGGRIVAQGTPDELKRRVPGGHVRLRFVDPAASNAAAAAFDGAVSDAAALAVEIPYDGSVSALRSVLARLDTLAIEVEELSLHTPDLDDAFLALTDTHRDPERVVA